MENEEWVTGNITLRIGGIPVKMELTVPAAPVKPPRMLPIFHQMANAIVGFSEEGIRNEGKEISCKMGCGACCRQPVPISEAEVYQIAALVDEMPEPRRSVIRERFRVANEYFGMSGWYDRVAALAEKASAPKADYLPKELLDEAMGYFSAGVACPFLEDESCSIHESRPLTCREYLVTSPAKNCANPTAETIDKVPLLLHPSRAMRLVGQTGLLAQWGILPLVRALDIAAKVPEQFEEKTGERWAAEFFGHLTKREIPETGIKPPSKRRRKPRQKNRKN